MCKRDNVSFVRHWVKLVIEEENVGEWRRCSSPKQVLGLSSLPRAIMVVAVNIKCVFAKLVL